MIFVSSCSVKSKYIKDSIIQLAENGIKNIELTGGTNYYDDYLNDIIELKEKYNLNYQVHNYFPPPAEHFMLNLASLDKNMYQNSIQLCRSAIDICKKIGCDKYGVHAGFLIDFSANEAGKKIKYRKLYDREEALNKFANAIQELNEYAGKEVKIYIENNVLSKTNADTYQGRNPFFLTDKNTYKELSERARFNLLLDLAHLKVSTNSLNLNFQDEVRHLIQFTDYLHISDNDGMHDQNFDINSDSEMFGLLKKLNLSNKTITLEVYNGIDSIKRSIDLLSGICN